MDTITRADLGAQRCELGDGATWLLDFLGGAGAEFVDEISAFCACAAAVKIARLSFCRTSSHHVI
jgi:hypothetical protein